MRKVAKFPNLLPKKRKKSGSTYPCSNAKGRKIFSSTTNGSGKTGPTTRLPVTHRSEYQMGNNQAERAQFVEFTHNSQIGAFGPALSPSPKRGESYNDDAAIPLYASSRRSYAGSQRKGIWGRTPDIRECARSCDGALKAPFFLAQLAHIPPSADKAVEFLATSCRRAVSAFCKKQLG